MTHQPLLFFAVCAADVACRVYKGQPIHWRDVWFLAFYLYQVVSQYHST